MNKANRIAVLLLSSLLLVSCGSRTSSNQNNYGGGGYNGGGYNGGGGYNNSPRDLSYPTGSYDYGYVSKQQVINYMKEHTQIAGEACLAMTYETSTLIFEYVTSSGKFYIINRTKETVSGVTLTISAGVIFDWGDFQNGSFAASLDYEVGSTTYTAYATYIVSAQTFGEAPAADGPVTVRVDYGNLPSSLRSNASSMAQIAWDGIQIGIRYADGLLENIATGCHLWGGGQTRFETGSAAEKTKLIDYLQTNDYYGDSRIGHSKSSYGNTLHFWYDPSTDSFVARVFRSTELDSTFNHFFDWTFKFGSFIRGGRTYETYSSYIDDNWNYVSKSLFWNDDMVTLRSDHTYRVNTPSVKTNAGNWSSSIISSLTGDAKTAVSAMLDFVVAEWKAAGISVNLW